MAVPTPFESWANFYVIAGSSAGALTGLQFVVLTLVAQSDRVGGSEDSIGAFGTPNVVHFCAALLVSAIVSAPWHALGQPGALIAATGIAGSAYSVVVLRRALRQEVYDPVLEDWIWHTILPAAAYVALVVAGSMLPRAVDPGLYVTAGAELLLLFVGIHNAWDTVTYVTVQQVQRQRKAREERERAAQPNAPSSGTERSTPRPDSQGRP